MANRDPISIAVIQTAFIGDIALTSSFLRDLRSLYPTQKILFVTTPIGVELLSPNPWRIELISFSKRGADAGPRGLWRKANQLKARGVSRVYCLHRSARSSMLTWLTGAPERLGFYESAMSWMFTKRVERKNFLFEAQKNRALLLAGESAPQELPDAIPELFVSDEDERQTQELLGDLPAKGFLAIAPSSVWATKRWPAERYGEVAAHVWNQRQIPTVLIGSGDSIDRALSGQAEQRAKQLIAKQDHARAIFNLDGKTSIGVLKGVLGRAKVLLGNDSSPLHIAIARNTNVVAIFGSTTRELGFFPFAPPGRSATVELSALACRPCGPHGHRKCPQKHFRCMLDLDTGLVIKALEPFL